MIVVDSSVWIDFYSGTVTRESEYLDSILGVVPLAAGDVIIGSYRIDEKVPLLFSDKDFQRMVDHGGLRSAPPSGR